MVFVKNCKFLESLILVKVAYNYFLLIFWTKKKGFKVIKMYVWKKIVVTHGFCEKTANSFEVLASVKIAWKIFFGNILDRKESC